MRLCLVFLQLQSVEAEEPLRKAAKRKAAKRLVDVGSSDYVAGFAAGFAAGSAAAASGVTVYRDNWHIRKSKYCLRSPYLFSSIHPFMHAFHS